MNRSRVRRCLRHPALHFSLLGVALFLGEAWLGAGVDGVPSAPLRGDAGAPRELTVGTARIEQLRGQWQTLSGRLPDARQEDWLIRQWVEEEMLYREALELGLDRDDPGVCYRLTLNMRFLGLDRSLSVDGSDRESNQRQLCRRARELGLHRGDPVIRRQMAGLMRLALKNAPTLLRGAPEPVSREQLQDYVERHPERFSEPARVRMKHVFVSRDRRGDSLEEDASHLLRRLVAESPGGDARSQGDPFLPGSHPEISSRRDLERVFGSAFARAVMELPEGRWSGPVESGFGLHPVWIDERRPPRLRTLEEVETQALLGLRAERAERRLAAALERMRARWVVRIERSNDVPSDEA